MKEIIIYMLDSGTSTWRFIVIAFIPLLILWLFFNLILQIIHKLIRAKTIRLKGYPPAHCDGDGDMLPDAGTANDKGISPIK